MCGPTWPLVLLSRVGPNNFSHSLCMCTGVRQHELQGGQLALGGERSGCLSIMSLNVSQCEPYHPAGERKGHGAAQPLRRARASVWRSGLEALPIETWLRIPQA